MVELDSKTKDPWEHWTHSQNWKQLKCQVFWARLHNVPSFGQLQSVSFKYGFKNPELGSMITKDQKYELYYTEVRGDIWRPVYGITCNSRAVGSVVRN